MKFGGEPDGYPKNHLPESRNIIDSVDGARRGALARKVPPAEQPAESAAKKRQCESSHRSKERDECATRASAERKARVCSGRQERFHDPA